MSICCDVVVLIEMCSSWMFCEVWARDGGSVRKRLVHWFGIDVVRRE